MRSGIRQIDHGVGPVTGWGVDSVLVSDEDFMDLVTRMCFFCSKRRMAEREALGHRWFANVKGRERGVIKITA